MKKILFSALVAAVLGAFANDCTPADPVVVDPTLVYRLKMTVKTTKGLIGTTTTDSSTVCTPGDITTTATVIRLPDTTKFDGYIYDCTATCSTIADGSAVVWDSKRKAQLNDAAMEKTLIHVIGSKQTQAEWAFKLTGTATYNFGDAAYDLTYAGFGKFSKGYYKSFSGNFAGTVDAVTYTKGFKPTTADDCVPAGYWLCDALTELVTEEPAVAYGCWSAKYSKSASKKFSKNGYLKVPSYVTIPEA